MALTSALMPRRCWKVRRQQPPPSRSRSASARFQIVEEGLDRDAGAGKHRGAPITSGSRETVGALITAIYSAVRRGCKVRDRVPLAFMNLPAY